MMLKIKKNKPRSKIKSNKKKRPKSNSKVLILNNYKNLKNKYRLKLIKKRKNNRQGYNKKRKNKKCTKS